MAAPRALVAVIRSLHDRIRSRVLDACSEQPSDRLARIVDDGAGDTIFAIDRVSEEELTAFFDTDAVGDPIILLAEGLPEEGLTLPRGAGRESARWRVIVDPIDGTRCIMYQKRSGWILTGVAPNRGDETRLQDIEVAVQTEIPLVKQHLSDQLWTVRGEGVHGERVDRLTGKRETIRPTPSGATTIAHGCASICRFFPGARDVLGAVDEDLTRRVLGVQPQGKALTFDDQYPSTGGQLYGLIMGQDRFVADLRPLADAVVAHRRAPLGLCCHPYDICTKLIAEQSGVIVTDALGRPLDSRLDLSSDLAWIGYANDSIRRQVEPVLQEVLREHGLLEGVR